MSSNGKRVLGRLGGIWLLALVLGITLVPVYALGSSEPALEQECLAAGLVEPQIIHTPEMHHAGIRPLTPHLWHSQDIQGMFSLPAMPEGCAPSFNRTLSGQLQMQKASDRTRWINQGTPHNPQALGNEAVRVQLSFGPTHAWPDYLFNECVGGGGWLEVRDVLTLRLRDGQTHQVIGQRRYIFSVQVHGNCRRARYSKKATAHYKEEWGGSGRERITLAPSKIRDLRSATS